MTDLLAAHGQGGIGNRASDEAYFSSFLVADGRGAWVLETSGRTWAARPVTTGAAISNRLTLTTDWSRASANVPAGTDFDTWRHPKMWTGHADVRLAANRRAVVERAADVPPADVVAALRNHGTGPWGAPGADPTRVAPPPAGPGFDPGTGDGVTVCMHLRDYQATTSSTVAELPADEGPPVRVWVALGSPCASIYVPGFLPSGVAAALADVSTAERFASLARSVEGADGAARLADIRVTLGPLETDLWHEADDLVARGDARDEVRVRSFVDTAWTRVDAALRRLGT
jgi:secernin